MGEFLDFPTVIVIVVAIVVLLRLRSVLGTRTGNERSPLERRNEAAAKAGAKPGDDTVVQMRPRPVEPANDGDLERRARKLEAEIAQLDDPDDVALFLAEYAIDRPSRERVIHLSYELLGIHSFFTYGDDEVRAWSLRKGGTAVEAAAAIHTDLARGFIRAEVIAYEDFIDAGSVNEVKARGKMRLEGKEYVVHDGDMIIIRFNI